MNFYQNWCIKKAKIKEDRLTKFYKDGESILDIGSGNCGLNLLLQKQGKNITGVDIAINLLILRLHLLFMMGLLYLLQTMNLM